jgi:hypothetical protein
MNYARNFWKEFKANPDIWFFYGFLVTFTLSIRKVLVFYPLGGVFNEYAGIYLYLSDLFLIFTIVFWFLSYLYNKKINLSIYTHKLSTLINRHNLLITLPAVLIVWSFASIAWSVNWQISLFRSIKFLEFYLLYIYVIFKFVVPSQLLGNVPSQYDRKCSTPVARKCSTWNISGATGQAWNNFSLRDARGTLFEFTGWNNSLPRDARETIFRRVIQILIFTGLFQSIIGIWQFIIQKSVGLFWLKESQISPSIDGVAKILIDEEMYIRAYGLFPHPNILGGFLLVSIILSLFYKGLFHPSRTENVPSRKEENCSTPAQRDQNVPPRKFQECSTWNILETRGTRGTFWSFSGWNNSLSRDARGTFAYLLPIFVLIQIIALFLTFSKSAWIGLILALGYIYLKTTLGCSTPAQRDQNVPPRKFQECSTWNILETRGTRGTFWSFSGWNIFSLRDMRGTILVAGIAIIVLALFMAKINFSDFLLGTLKERIVYMSALPQYNVLCSVLPRQNDPPASSADKRGTICSNVAWNNDDLAGKVIIVILGIGNGQFVLEMQKYSQTQLEYWQFQPVHNVFLLIWSELGIIGLVIFLWFIWKLFNSDTIECFPRAPREDKMFHPEKKQFVPRGTNCFFWAGVEHFRLFRGGTFRSFSRWNNKNSNEINFSFVVFKGILLGLIFIMLFDHYLWDIQQGQVILGLIAGIIANNALYKPKDSMLTK